MPTAEQIKQRIEVALPGARAQVEDYTGTGDHFRATVSAPQFVGVSRIEQHRLVYEVFEDEIGGPIHALSLKTQAPGTTVAAEPASTAASSPALAPEQATTTSGAGNVS